MTIPNPEMYALRSEVRRHIIHVVANGSVEQTIDTISELDKLRKLLDRVQANPHLLNGRAQAMVKEYRGADELERLSK